MTMIEERVRAATRKARSCHAQGRKTQSHAYPERSHNVVDARRCGKILGRVASKDELAVLFFSCNVPDGCTRNTRRGLSVWRRRFDALRGREQQRRKQRRRERVIVIGRSFVVEWQRSDEADESAGRPRRRLARRPRNGPSRSAGRGRVVAYHGRRQWHSSELHRRCVRGCGGE
jgi:hypothetical protein